MVDDREILQEPLTAPRIGLVVSYLPINNNRSHLYVVGGFIEAIACAYKDFSVMLLIANDDEKLIGQGAKIRAWKQKYTKKNYTAVLTRLMADFLGAEIAKNVTVKVVKNEAAPLRRSLTLIDEFKPDMLFYWGGVYGCSTLRRMTYQRYPIGFGFFNIKNHVDQNADIYITRDVEQQVFGPHDPEKCVFQPLVIKLPEAGHAYPAGYVKKSADEVTITTVISAERLAQTFRTYTKDRLDRLFNVFKQHCNARWLFIGPNTPEEILNIDPRFAELASQDRIEIIKREPYLRAFFQHCDLYVHLPGLVGGAGGVAMARVESVATLCYADSDACGAQLPSAIYRDDDALFSAISFYIEHKEERVELGKDVCEFMTTQCGSEAVSAKLRENIALARKNYLARQSVTPN